MPDTPEDPVDHSGTARRFAGEAMKIIRTSPGLVFSALALVALVSSVDILALGYVAAAVLAVGIAVVAAGVGALWVFADHRRVVRDEVRWLSGHPDLTPEPPTG